MKFDHANTVFVSISFRHTFLSSLVLVAWSLERMRMHHNDLDVRAAIRENENVRKKKGLEIFRLQGTKSAFLQP